MFLSWTLMANGKNFSISNSKSSRNRENFYSTNQSLFINHNKIMTTVARIPKMFSQFYFILFNYAVMFNYCHPQVLCININIIRQSYIQHLTLQMKSIVVFPQIFHWVLFVSVFFFFFFAFLFLLNFIVFVSSSAAF